MTISGFCGLRVWRRFRSRRWCSGRRCCFDHRCRGRNRGSDYRSGRRPGAAGTVSRFPAAMVMSSGDCGVASRLSACITCGGFLQVEDETRRLGVELPEAHALDQLAVIGRWQRRLMAAGRSWAHRPPAGRRRHGEYLYAGRIFKRQRDGFLLIIDGNKRMSSACAGQLTSKAAIIIK